LLQPLRLVRRQLDGLFGSISRSFEVTNTM